MACPDRDYYLDPSERQAKIREQYLAHVTTMFKLAGDTPEQAAAEAASVMAIETALAKVSFTRTELRVPEKNYHILTLAEFDKLAPNFDWSAYFTGIGIGKFDSLDVGQPDFFKGMSDTLGAQSLDSLKSYLRWHALHNAAPWLSQPFDQENYNFYQATLSGPERADSPLEALHTSYRCQPRRSSRTGLGQQELSSRRQGEHEQAGGGPGYRSLAGHQDSLPWMSDDDQEAGAREAGADPQQDRLSRKLDATTPAWR